MAVVGIDFGCQHSLVFPSSLSFCPADTDKISFRSVSRDIEELILSQTKFPIVQHRTSLWFLSIQHSLLMSFRSLIGFGPKQRAIGEAAKTQETSNFKNTIGSLKRLIARNLNDRQVQDIEKKFLNAKLVDVNGSVGAEASSWFF
jgi:molecular chaperone DnaK (HSP70)